ncbi:DUF2790 domain-containing protein [Pseudomonas sp. GD03944]|uniref:DUF2790 domain-containing protein n=1 Tax=Pseudomonas sp. GD03944 TaxID=2975409 RepID=UPI00244C184C|nr:DUF2790 domain-containing protein [Pseudomonas sp. GD03944]MDH1262451.1 DUF2790 domain-containing protein [Pseudomonas sp. GD03944]
MNIRPFSFAGLLVVVLASPSLFAEERSDTPAYRYGSELDVARVIRIEEPQPTTCEVVQATMTYETSRGDIETLTFLKEASVCISNG